jgi:hypothetical protein
MSQEEILVFVDKKSIDKGLNISVFARQVAAQHGIYLSHSEPQEIKNMPDIPHLPDFRLMTVTVEKAQRPTGGNRHERRQARRRGVK